MKNQKMLILFIVAASMMSSCRKDDADDFNVPGGTSSTQVNATISGRVLTETGAGLSGVTVSAYGSTATTDADGIFLIQGSVEKNRCILEFNKTGYLKRMHAIIPSSTKVNYVRIILQDEPLPQSFQSANGGSITFDHGGSVAFPANSFVIAGTSTPYNGLVTFVSKHIYPDDPHFSMVVPGGDLSGIDANGDDVTLYSYGMAGVTITGTGGENLQLGSGINATITFPIAPTQSGTAPQSIPLWYLDEEDALWKEEGNATRVGNNYIGIVSHFTWWNCDYSEARSTIQGRVVDCEGTPFANVTVTVNGQMTVVTDQDGSFTHWVPSGLPLSFVVLPQDIILQPSQTENVAPLTNGQTFTVPDLVVQCVSSVNGRLTDCNGENINGAVALKFNNQVQQYVFVTEGNFSIRALPFTNYTLIATATSGSFLMNLTSVGQSAALEIGDIQACNVSTASTRFTLNGMGYVNALVSLDIEEMNQANYYAWSNTTQGYVNGISNQGTCNLNIGFEGNAPITIDATIETDSTFFLNLNGVYLIPNPTSTNHLMITITEYGAIGDSIKGTFEGDVINYTSLQPCTITNGRFAFLRGQDY